MTVENRLAERVGFEPTVAIGYTRSPGAPDRPLQHLSINRYGGGEGGIRTHAPLTRRPLFESGTMNHSDTSPGYFLKLIYASLDSPKSAKTKKTNG